MFISWSTNRPRILSGLLSFALTDAFPKQEFQKQTKKMFLGGENIPFGNGILGDDVSR